ncbi:MAG: 3-deoxy-manno-octulosonate cytidylyltransferase (CMP-KDO synthetase) [Arenicella sp.]|jgi:3-deoxy-manno-octulosonate cytidylyltransferase (CMP-KDO synthetase)
MSKIIGIIPARYASTRFPAKPLVDIAGKSMIQRVYEQCKKSKSLSEVVVATDHELIFRAVEEFGGKAVMTAENHPSGTDRCYEAFQKSGGDFDYAINIQGDEPFIEPEQIDLLADLLQSNQTQIATLANKITQSEELFDANAVKVVRNGEDEGIYFSRSPIPFLRGVERENWVNQQDYFRHLGIYAFRSDVLAQITRLPMGKLEQAESLEQLRWLENGYSIKVGITPHKSVGIDSPEDLEKVLKERFGIEGKM